MRSLRTLEKAKNRCNGHMLNFLEHNRTQQFWFLQLVGWSTYSLIAFFVGPIWYGSSNLLWDALVVILQSLVGAVLTLPLRSLFRILWNSSLILRIGLSIVAVTFVAILWTFLRMELFSYMMPSLVRFDIVKDFGGWFYVSIIVMAAWSAFYYGIRYYQLMEVERDKAQQALLSAKDAQIRMLRYQLNPHFLFNTLNTACALMDIRRIEPAQRMLVRLSDFLRYSLDTPPDQLISLDKEVEMLMLYLDIEKARFGEQMRLDFQIDDAARTAKVPSLLLQPLYENSIKYAVSAQAEGGVIGLRAWLEDGHLYLRVSDDGPGPNASDGEFRSRKGIGLSNTRERLKTLFGDNCQFSVGEQDTAGFVVNMRIPHLTGEQG